jgi:rod shape-determining protein MreD
MRSFSSVFPAVLGIVLLSFFAVPMQVGNIPLCPNVGMLMTLVVVSLQPAAWPRWFALVFGVLQDVVFGTPLGVHALLLVALVGTTEHLSQRTAFQQFRMRWMEAAGLLVLWHVLLWCLLHVLHKQAATVLMIGQSAVVTILWYPLFYGILARTSKAN